MKNFALIFLSTFALFSCQEASKNTSETTATETTAAATDSVAIASLVHDFYKWYGTFQQDTSQDLNFINDSGKHLKLDLPKLNAYYENFKKTGLVSDEFIKNEIEYYKSCEAQWQTEQKGDMPSCLEFDKYACGQDWDPTVYTTAPVAFKIEDPSRVYVSMPISSDISLGFIVKKVNGKWLLDTAGCGIDE